MTTSSGNVGTLSVSLVARTNKFKKNIKSAQKTTNSFGDSLRRMAKKTTLAVGAIGALAAGGLSVLVKKQFDALDAAGKLSDRIGILTEDLIGLQHAAQISGVGTESLDKSLVKMQRSIGDALDGSGEAVEAFESIGLSAQNLATMGPDAAFKAIADALRELPTAAQRTDAAMRIFGKSGADLLNLIDLGTDGIQGLQDEAKQLGIAMSRDAAAKIEQANDAMTRLQMLAVGLGRKIAVALAPFISALVGDLTAMGTEGANSFSMIDKAASALATTVGILGDTLDSIRWLSLEVEKAWLSAFEGIANAAAGFFHDLGNMLAQSDNEALQGLAGTAHAFSAGAAAAGSAAGIGAGVKDRELQEFLVSDGFSERLRKRMDQAEKDATAAADKLEKEMQRSSQAFEDVGQAAAEAAPEIQAATEAATFDAERPQSMLGSIQSAIGQFTVGQNSVVNEIKKQTTQLVRAIDSSSSGMTITA